MTLLAPFRSASRLAWPIGSLYVLSMLFLAACVWTNPSQCPLLVGTGLTAFLIGVRHAFDLDHIATIDATVRELNARGKPSAAVGFRFAADTPLW
jgi:high-affinity nickel-transport protein